MGTSPEGVAAPSEERARFLTATWRDLLMINYEVDPEALQPYVPAGVELDTHDGRHLASLVGFRFLDTRLKGIRIPLHADFEEVNLRFYVRRRGPEGWRRGVVFVKEIVPRRAISLVARIVYGEKYVTLPMRHRVEPERSFEYEWRTSGRWNRLAARVEGEPQLPEPGSEEEFITEHYWGYTRRRRGRTAEYGVEHPTWRAWHAKEHEVECDVEGLYGAEFVERLSAEPTSVFVAEGSPVVVRAATVLAS